MTAATQFLHLTEDVTGAVRIGTTRYKVSHLAAEHYSYGWSAEELLRQHPDLKPQEVYAALAYFYDHFDEMVEQLQGAAKTAGDLRRNQTLTRDELLRHDSRVPPHAQKAST